MMSITGHTTVCGSSRMMASKGCNHITLTSQWLSRNTRTSPAEVKGEGGKVVPRTWPRCSWAARMGMLSTGHGWPPWPPHQETTLCTANWIQEKKSFGREFSLKCTLSWRDHKPRVRPQQAVGQLKRLLLSQGQQALWFSQWHWPGVESLLLQSFHSRYLMEYIPAAELHQRPTNGSASLRAGTTTLWELPSKTDCCANHSLTPSTHITLLPWILHCTTSSSLLISHRALRDSFSRISKYKWLKLHPVIFASSCCYLCILWINVSKVENCWFW